MEWIEDAWRRTDLRGPIVATIGNYDGVHRGQRAILESVVASADRHAAPATVITFEPHPLAIVAPEREPRRLTTRDQKRELLDESGIDRVLEIRFDEGFAATQAEAFVRDFLVARLEVREIRVGSRFGFGWRKHGNLELLETLGKELGFATFGCPEVEVDGRAISSTRIREAVSTGAVENAARMLGRAFALRGTIVTGQRQGSGLGWPTINLQAEQNAIPAHGVYLSHVRLADEEAVLPAVTNVGVRPTVTAGDHLVVESHILDFSRDVYGYKAEVGFLQRLRDERTFPNVEALKTQIERDVREARRRFSRLAN